MQSYTTHISQIDMIAPDIYMVWLACAVGETMSFRAGQYILIQPPVPLDAVKPPAGRAYSIAGYRSRQVFPSGGEGSEAVMASEIAVIFRRQDGGVCSTYLATCQVGDTVSIKGPAGHFQLSAMSHQPSATSYTFIATGTGIGPIRCMLQQLSADPSSTRAIHLIWGLRTVGDTYLVDGLGDLLRKSAGNNHRFDICLSQSISPQSILPEVTFHSGRIQSCFPSLGLSEDPLSNQHLFICGHGPFVQETKSLLLAVGVEYRQIMCERYS